MALPPGVREIGRIPGPNGQGTIILGSDGGVFSEGGAPFHGSYFSLDEKHRNDPNRQFTGIEARDGGGYTLRTNKADEHYDFGPGAFSVAPPAPAAPAPNPILEDPAYLAFVRTSGLDLEYAAGEAERQQGAINRALETRIGDLGDTQKQGQRNIVSSAAARGGHGSGDRLRAQSDYDTQTAKTVADERTKAATTIATLRSDLANRVADTAREAAEKGLGSTDKRYGEYGTGLLKAITDGGNDDIAGLNRRLREYTL